MFGLVIAIAFVGGGYFVWQDTKKDRDGRDKDDSDK